MQTTFGNIYTVISSLEKNNTKAEKIINKRVINVVKPSLRPRRTRTPMTLSISDELANFLGKPVGSEMRRTDIIYDIIRYIRSKNLIDGPIINPDENIRKILKLPENNGVISIFDINIYVTSLCIRQSRDKKPTLISNELAEFLGKAIGTEMSRTEVSKEIISYINAHGLQDPINGDKVNPDEKLRKLLKLNDGDELTYFNLHTYMKHHFIKPVV